MQRAYPQQLGQMEKIVKVQNQLQRLFGFKTEKINITSVFMLTLVTKLNTNSFAERRFYFNNAIQSMLKL